MKSLRLAPDLSLPLDAVTRTFGVLAVRGAGKSNTAAVMAEEMFDAGLPFVVVDPVGSWYGLRANATGGKDGGLAVPIFGGKHGDLPLERGAGELLADLVAEKRLSCVLDLSRFDSEGDKKAFLLAFAKRLYQKNEDPLHLFLEEADDYIPQKPFREEAQLLRAWENIVRRGRARGLGLTLITQRSAALNKMVLTQVETLFAMRTTGPQDIKAIEAWVQYHQVGKEVVASLAQLADGEAWVWSPHFLNTMKRVQIRRRRTFDSGATPKNLRGDTGKKPATLADVDLSALQVQMSKTIEKAKADDPKELRRRIAELERQVKAKPAAAPAGAKVEAKVVEKPVLKEGQLARLEKVTERAAAAIVEFQAAQREVAEAVRLTRSGEAKRLIDAQRPREMPSRAPLSSGTGRQRGTSPLHPKGDTDLSRSQQRILDALAWMEGVGIAPADKTQLALLADQSPTSSGYSNNLGTLRTAGYIEYPAPAVVSLTTPGRGVVNPADIPTTNEELHEMLFQKLPGSQVKILKELIYHYPEVVGKDDLATWAGQSPTSSGYSNNLGRLRSLGLIDYPAPGRVVAQPVLFLNGRR